MQDFNWSDSVEVRGKVRLEAFEKYVQDLPRSRSRGLMVRAVAYHCSYVIINFVALQILRSLHADYRIF